MKNITVSSDDFFCLANDIGGEVVEDYSGRGMFGKTCWGIICGNINECIESGVDYGLKGAKSDNMGEQYIVYYPYITVIERH